MKVGDKVWQFQNYRRGSFRESWRELSIIGENRVSWIIGRDKSSTIEVARLNKKALAAGKCDLWATSRDAIEAEAVRRDWIAKHASDIRDRVRVCEDPEKLRQIGVIVGYDVVD